MLRMLRQLRQLNDTGRLILLQRLQHQHMTAQNIKLGLNHIRQHNTVLSVRCHTANYPQS